MADVYIIIHKPPPTALLRRVWNAWSTLFDTVEHHHWSIGVRFHDDDHDRFAIFERSSSSAVVRRMHIGKAKDDDEMVYIGSSTSMNYEKTVEMFSQHLSATNFVTSLLGRPPAPARVMSQ